GMGVCTHGEEECLGGLAMVQKRMSFYQFRSSFRTLMEEMQTHSKLLLLLLVLIIILLLQMMGLFGVGVTIFVSLKLLRVT
ncbi:hypothetical protein PIB30_031454, partial [Stylosanthes scabra]|nr:hypothetical protein [Stylosanthes scabra]